MIAVALEHLTKRFGDFVAVDDVTLSIEEGCIYGFLGPNGSGKSTTIRMICGLLSPTSGTVRVLGTELAGNGGAGGNGTSLRRHMGYMSQKFSLYGDLTVRENLDFYAGMYSLSGTKRKERVEAMLAMADLDGRERVLTSTLSTGVRQRLALGCAMLHEPKILFLDEPTSGVDPGSRRRFWERIYDLAEGGTTVMVTTHFMDEAEHCDRLGFIFQGGLIASGTPEELKRLPGGTLYAVPSEAPMALLQELERAAPSGLLDAYVCGNSLHVLAEGGLPGLFDTREHRVISPSLEDVFVFLVRKGRSTGE